jgi:hypothetical protein
VSAPPRRAGRWEAAQTPAGRWARRCGMRPPVPRGLRGSPVGASRVMGTRSRPTAPATGSEAQVSPRAHSVVVARSHPARVGGARCSRRASEPPTMTNPRRVQPDPPPRARPGPRARLQRLHGVRRRCRRRGSSRAAPPFVGAMLVGRPPSISSSRWRWRWPPRSSRVRHGAALARGAARARGGARGDRVRRALVDVPAGGRGRAGAEGRCVRAAAQAAGGDGSWLTRWGSRGAPGLRAGDPPLRGQAPGGGRPHRGPAHAEAAPDPGASSTSVRPASPPEAPEGGGRRGPCWRRRVGSSRRPSTPRSRGRSARSSG